MDTNRELIQIGAYGIVIGFLVCCVVCGLYFPRGSQHSASRGIVVVSETAGEHFVAQPVLW